MKTGNPDDRHASALDMLSALVVAAVVSGSIAGLLEIGLILPTRVALQSKSTAYHLLLPPLGTAPFFIAANLLVALALAGAILAGKRIGRESFFRVGAGLNALFLSLFLVAVYRVGTADSARSAVDRLGGVGFFFFVLSSTVVVYFLYRHGLLPALARSRTFRHVAAAGLVLSITGTLAVMLRGEGRKSIGPAGTAPSPAQAGGREADNLLLITIDTQRSDHVGCYRGVPVDTPNIDRLAREGVRFESCIAQVPTTLPSHTTIMTATYPTFHRVRTNHGYRVRDSLDTLAEVLRDRGYRTAAFVSAFVLDTRFGLDQGFDLYDCDLGHQSLLFTGLMKRTLSSMAWRALFSMGERPTDRVAGETTERALRWLDHVSSGPFFLWIHYFDPHSPYDPPPPYRSRYLDEVEPGLEGTVSVVTLGGTRSIPRASLEVEKARYRGEVTYTDHNIGILLEELRRKGVLDHTLVVLTADHGESFAENDYYGHGKMLNPPSIRVPLIFRRPGVLPAGRTVSGISRSVDIMPTILDCLGIEGPEAMQGESLLPYIRSGEALPDRAVYCETMTPPIDELKRVGLIQGGWKYVTAPRGDFEALYRLSDDPGETRNLAAIETAKRDEMRARLTEMLIETSSAEEAERIHLDDDAVSALRALGYVQ
jgi:arylsulfatase A-like enzyme